MIEIWKDIKGYEGLYQVSNLGRVKRLEHKRYDRNQILKERIIKTTYPKNGWYPYLSLCRNGIYKNHNIHRLVAEAFIPNPNKYPIINHIDGNKQNNSLDNLEWCTFSHNNREACRLGLNKGTAKTTLQFDKQGNLIKEWFSTRKAEKELKIANGKVSDCCIGKRKSAGGFIWKYKEVILNDNERTCT